MLDCIVNLAKIKQLVCFMEVLLPIPGVELIESMVVVALLQEGKVGRLWEVGFVIQ